MRTEIFGGGSYCDNLPNGEFAVYMGGSIQTHFGPINAPPLLFVRITNQPHFRIAAKTQSPGNVTVWDGQWNDDPRISHGVQGHIWRNGVLEVIEPGEHIESQGIRYVASDGSLIGGSPTMSAMTPFAASLGVTRLAAWTDLGDGIFVGQSDVGHIVFQKAGTHRVLIEGHWEFVQAKRLGSLIAIAAFESKQTIARLWWLDVSEIDALPPLAAVAQPDPQPNPQPIPEPEPDVPEDLSPYLDPALIRFVEGVTSDYPHLVGGEGVDQVAHRLNRHFGWTGDAIRYGRKARRNDPGNPNLNEDALTFRLDNSDNAKKKLIDIYLGGETGPTNIPVWIVRPAHEEPGNGFWWPPVSADRDGVSVPVPPTTPGQPPVQPSGIDLTRDVKALIAAALAPTLAELADVRRKLLIVSADLDALKDDVGGFPERIALRSLRTGHLLCNDAELPEGHQIQAGGGGVRGRDAIGEWETWTIERV
jgi:hypothetical protein